MSLPSDWRPVLGQGGTLHEQLLAALRQDILSGVLAAGAKLPTHRALAERLGLAVGTVTKVYAQAERMGLVASRIGSGTYVSPSGSLPKSAGLIDLTLNLPPIGPSASRLRAAMTRLRDRPDLLEHACFAPHLGFEAHRKAAAAWLMRTSRYTALDWRRLAICGGAQQALFLALDVLCRPGDLVMAEAVTFHGFKMAAAHRGWSLAGLAIDGEGLVPEAFEREAAAGRSRVLYVQPTLQNPTACTMSPSRRSEIVRIARRYDVIIVESDIYAPLAWRSEAAANSDLLPLAVLAPERTCYVSSVSKVIAPGLRAGFLAMPDGSRLDQVARAMRANCYAACAIGPLIATEWIESGIADDILADIANEAASRTAVAREMLGPHVAAPSHSSTLHLWLPLGEAAAERAAARALQGGVQLTPPSIPIIDGTLASGLRVCIGAPPDMATLRRALDVISKSVSSSTDPSEFSSVI